jgi:hypothetical protein
MQQPFEHLGGAFYLARDCEGFEEASKHYMGIVLPFAEDFIGGPSYHEYHYPVLVCFSVHYAEGMSQRSALLNAEALPIAGLKAHLV